VIHHSDHQVISLSCVGLNPSLHGEQTNISHNNNKFYVLQMLQDDNKKSFWVWTRWGRGMPPMTDAALSALCDCCAHQPVVHRTVGAIGQSKLSPCGSSVDKAKKEFNKKYATAHTPAHWHTPPSRCSRTRVWRYTTRFLEKTGNAFDDRAEFEPVTGKYTMVELDYGANDDDDVRVRQHLRVSFEWRR
jgi:poly [ADP-ribose] polymerase